MTNHQMDEQTNKTVFAYSDGSVQTADVVGTLSRKHYAIPNGAELTGVSIGNRVSQIDENAFKGCASLTSVNIPDSVTELGFGAFANCTALTSIVIPKGVTDIGWWTFTGCTALASAILSNEGTKIGFGTFAGCTSLTSVSIPSSVTVIHRFAFKDVPHITYHGDATGAPWGALAIN